ncbi:hypothetical protein Hanom_Chr08g00732101 [Helianthus anomalus]
MFSAPNLGRNSNILLEFAGLLLHLTLINLRWLLIMFSLIVPPFTSICMMFLK